MQRTNAQRADKLVRFIRNNIALIIIIACILTITAIVIVVSVNRNTNVPASNEQGNTNNPPVAVKPDEDEEQARLIAEAKKFILPIEYTSISMDYTDDKDNLFVFNSTLDMWLSHRAVDLVAPIESNVVSMRAGTVKETGFTYGYGNYVTVDHGDGIVATYSSLSDPKVIAGQKLDKGTVIANPSDSAYYEFNDGAHVHISMTVNGKVVNPWDYMPKSESESK